MTSPVELVNMACDAIGVQAIINGINPPNPANSLAAQVASRNYQTQVDSIFRAANWGTGRRQVALTLLRAAYGTPENTTSTTNIPPQAFLYEYAYPTNCVRMRFVMPNANANAQAGVTPPPFGSFTGTPYPLVTTNMPFIRAIDTDQNGNEISVILTNVENALGVYTESVTNPDLWDPLLRNAVIAALAAYFVNPLNRNAQLLQERIAIAAAILKEARVANANETIANQDHKPDFMRVREIAGARWGMFSGAGGAGLPFGAFGYSDFDLWVSPLGTSY